MAAKCIFVGGTSSHAGKSWMVTAICAWLRKRGVRVAPFKAQNMSNNSYPCLGGGEIGRAQVAQAQACGLEPEPAMNPILLKPNSATGSQVIVHGKLWKTLPARGYYEHAPWLLTQVLDAYEGLASRFDFIVIEGAGSVAELNLRRVDLVNFGLATKLQAPALLVSDIERGGVFGSIIGTVSLLEPEERALLRSFAVNKFRGDLSLFDDGRAILEERTGVSCLGVFPYAKDIHVDDEDSLSVPAVGKHGGDLSSVAVIRLPRISNTTDFRLLRSAVWVDQPMDQPFAVVILPGTKNTIDDLNWLRERGLDVWIKDQHQRGARIVGVCGGYQMLGRSISDPYGMESQHQQVEGLGLLDMETVMSDQKTLRRVSGRTLNGAAFSGYEIHLGVSVWTKQPCRHFAITEDGRLEGAVVGRVYGTYLHGTLENPDVLKEVVGIDVPMERRRSATQTTDYGRLADWFAEHSRGFEELYL